jgi:hypothetical protein
MKVQVLLIDVTLRIAGGVYENTDAAATATASRNNLAEFEKGIAFSRCR